MSKPVLVCTWCRYCAERDQLRAEVERLREKWFAERAAANKEVGQLQAEVERLKDAGEKLALTVENETAPLRALGPGTTAGCLGRLEHAADTYRAAAQELSAPASEAPSEPVTDGKLPHPGWKPLQVMASRQSGMNEPEPVATWCDTCGCPLDDDGRCPDLDGVRREKGLPT